MSTGSAPCRGYVVAVTDELIKKLGLIKDTLLVAAENDTNIPINLHDLTGHGDTVDAFPFLYDADNGECYDDLEDGVLYLIFSETDLFIKTETEKFKALSCMGITPEEKSWTHFG